MLADAGTYLFVRRDQFGASARHIVLLQIELRYVNPPPGAASGSSDSRHEGGPLLTRQEHAFPWSGRSPAALAALSVMYAPALVFP